MGGAQLFPDFAIAGGLTGLTGELLQLVRQLLDHIIHAGEVLLGAVQLQLGLVAALIKTRDTGSLFKDAAARAGLGVDELGNLPLPHERRRMGTRRSIGKKHLHIAGADLFGTDLVGRARVAGDAADDFEVIDIVEARRREALGIVDMKRDLGVIAGRPRGRAGENHVFHAATAHRGGPVLAHHPAQRLE